MDSDDDYQSFSPPKEPSPQVHYRRLKRLKKSNSKTPKDPLLISSHDPLLFPQVDFAKLEALENGTETPDFSDPISTEEAILSQELLSQGSDNENEMENEDEIATRKVLEFDADPMGGVDANERANGEDSESSDPEKNEKKRIGEEDIFDKRNNIKRKKKKRVKSGSGGELHTNSSGSNKRREDKERKAYLKELHAESQRVLRETRDASFKPIPVVQKSISSVLEKIRKRKLDISKKAMVVNDRSYGYDGNGCPEDRLRDLDVSYEEREEENVEIIVEKQIVAPSLDAESGLAAPNLDECKDAAKQTIHENDQQMSPNEEPTPPFRAPVHDTQDLFDDSAPNGCTPVHDEEQSSPLKEDFAPSLLAMNLKFDSAPADDSSSDEDDNGKENVDPHPCGIAGGSSSPKGDFSKDFIDDEAEVEDDSDNDLIRFQENEEAEDVEDFKELNDMIAMEYEERPIDNAKRNELHQNWLEQQDAAGTDKLMQRLNCGSGLRDAMLLDKEPETDEDDEEFDDDDDEAKEDPLPRTSARINTRKAKQIILQLLPDKEDAYLSDNDDDTQRRHVRCLLIRKEKRATTSSPADDENSREVFGLIKKLNIVPDNKRKPKALSFFDSVLKGGNNKSSKPSFLGRVTNHPISSSCKQGSGTVRSFIFGREDSNSRSAISMSEDSSDTVSQETRPTRYLIAKYNNSRTKLTSQNRDAAVETSRTSLFEILKQSTRPHQVCNQNTAVDLTKDVFAFRAPKKPTKMEGRS